MTRRFVPGQRIRQLPGGSLNAAIDAAGRLGELLPPGGPQQQFRGTDAPRLVVQVVNSTGGELRERAVVGLGATVLELPALSDPSEAATAAVLVGEAVEAVLPDPEVHTAGRWGVTLAPIAAGQTGFVAVTGLIKIRVDVSDAGQRAVAPIADVTTHAAGAADGAPIVWRALQAEDPGTGLQWALVNLGAGSGGSTLRWGVVTTAADPRVGSTPGNGVVQLKNDDWTDAESVNFINFWPLPWPFEAVICVDTARNPAPVVSGTCTPGEDEEPEE